MKYKAIIEIDEFEDFEFFEDGNGKYLHAIDAGAENNEWIALYFTECQQDDVLDKIRAEIEEYKSRQLTLAIGVDDLEKGKQIALKYVLAILDKYKAESEDKE